MVKTIIIVLFVFGLNLSVALLLQASLFSSAALASEPMLRVVGHKCVKDIEILKCSGRVNNIGSTDSNLVDLIIYLKSNDGKITNMIETTTRPFTIATSGYGIYNITVSQSRLAPDWVTSGAFAFSR